MNSTTNIPDSHERCLNYARSLGNMQGTAHGVIYQLESIMLYGNLNDSDKASVQQAIDRLRKAVTETADPQAYGASCKI
jgi:hypothetical protein